MQMPGHFSVQFNSNIDKELFLPLAASAHAFDCIVGYFTSGYLEEPACSMVKGDGFILTIYGVTM